MHKEVINTILGKKHINLPSILRRGAQNLSIFHPHKRPLKDMNDSSLQLHLERKRKQMDVAPPPREPRGLQRGWMNNTENTRLNPPRSVPQLQQEPDSPLRAAVPLLLTIHGEKILLTHKTLSFTHKHSQPQLRTVRTPLTFHPAGETRHQVA